MARMVSSVRDGVATIVGYEDDPIDCTRLHYLQTIRGERYLIKGGRYGVDDPTGFVVRWSGRTTSRSRTWGGKTYTELTSCLMRLIDQEA